MVVMLARLYGGNPKEIEVHWYLATPRFKPNASGFVFNPYVLELNVLHTLNLLSKLTRSSME